MGEKPYLCLCLWRKIVVDGNEEKEGGKVLYRRKKLAKSAETFYGKK